MVTTVEFMVSRSGQVSVPAAVRRRWDLTEGGRITVMDLGDAVVLLQSGAQQRLLGEALPAEQHRRFVECIDDPDLATT